MSDGLVALGSLRSARWGRGHKLLHRGDPRHGSHHAGGSSTPRLGKPSIAATAGLAAVCFAWAESRRTATRAAM
eukprot:2619459-Prymnesium_polylepis.1